MQTRIPVKLRFNPIVCVLFFHVLVETDMPFPSKSRKTSLSNMTMCDLFLKATVASGLTGLSPEAKRKLPLFTVSLSVVLTMNSFTESEKKETLSGADRTNQTQLQELFELLFFNGKHVVSKK